MSCLTLNFKVKGHGHNIDIYIVFEFCDIDSVFSHRLQTQVSTIHTTRDIILNALCHVWPWISRSKSRSQYRYIFFWILWHQFGTNRHQTQVSTIYTTRDSILNRLCHAWPWISKLKVKVTTMRPIFLISWNLFSNRGYQTQVFMTYTTRDIIECITSCLTLNFKVEDQEHNINIFSHDINLVEIDTKLRFYHIAIKRYWTS